MPLETNLNVAPYYDDYSEEKNFHRVLFRPSVAVQARELTQLQSILQNQIERFGDNIYKTGTIIKGCGLSLDNQYPYIKILDTQIDGQPVSLGTYSNTLAIQESYNLQAFIVDSIQGLESLDPDLNTLYLKYQNTGTNGEKTFSAGNVIKIFNRSRTVEDITVISGGSLYSNSDTITFSGGGGSGATAAITTDATGEIVDASVQSKGTNYTSTPNVSITTSTGSGANLAVINYIAEITVASTANSVGTGLAVKSTDGVIYQKGNFVRVEPQTAIVEKYSQLANNKVIGFNTQESIVNSNVDSSLLDLSIGSPNYSAPGANRLKLTPTLTVLSKELAEANSTFLTLLEFQNGNVVKDRTYTQFNSINNELARRTNDESGDYVVNTIHLDTEEITGNTTHFNIVSGPGIAYVSGERIETLNAIRAPARKGTDQANTINQTINTSYGSYVIVKELLGAFEIKEGSTVNLRSAAATDVTDNPGGVPTAPGTLLGTAKVRSVLYDSGSPGTPTCTYKLFLFDIRMNSGGAFKDVRSISIGSTAIADVVLTNGIAVLRDIENDILIFNTGTFAVSELNSEEFYFRTSTNTSFSLSGNVEYSFSGGNTLPYGIGNLTDIDKQQFIIIPLESFRQASNSSGTVIANSATANITGTSTSFISDFEVGDYIVVSNGSSFSTPHRITNIYSNTSLAISNVCTQNAVGGAIYKAYPANVPIDFTKSDKEITITANNKVLVDVGVSINVAANFVMYHDLENFEPGVRTKTLNNPVYVKISTDKLAENLNGPWCLGIPDVLSIEAVYIGASNSYSESTTNYSTDFELDNGQRDNYYGLSYINRRPGSSISLSATSCLLVKVKAFTHTSGKYLSTESYPVDDITTPLPSNKIRTESIPVYISQTSGEPFSLRDSIDFRPIVSNTAILSSTAAGASIDPSATESLVSGEKFFPSPTRSFECSIKSYLPRVDRVVLTKSGGIRIIEGVSSVRPVAPPPERGNMDLGFLNIAPYPSLTSKQAATAKRPDLKNLITLLQTRRYTMKDIKSIEERLQRLEYYTLLNTLEANVATLAIPSAGNSSIEVFKNGFFVDAFDDYTVSNINDGEYKALVDTDRSRLIPQQEIVSVDLKFNASSSTNVTKTGDLVSLNYTEKELLSQRIANKERTLVEQQWAFKGNMLVVPRVDNFFDVNITGTTAIDINIADPLNSLVNAQNEINSRLTSSSSLVRTNRSVTSNSFTEGFITTTNFNETISRTFADTSTRITVPPVVTSTQEVNNLLTSVHINPYIRAQRIGLYVTGLRPGAQHYVFFDNVDLTSVSTPARLTNLNNPGITDFSEINRKGTSTGLFANNTGELAVLVDLPAETFTTGEKNFLIMDFSSLSSEVSATSKATGKFASFSTTGTGQNITFSTKSFEPGTSFNARTFTSRRTVNTFNSWTTFVDNTPVPSGDGGGDGGGGDPLAQTFMVQSQKGGEYLFLTSVDIFFKEKDTEKGVTLELYEVNDSGYPTILKLPFSTVYKKPNQITTSADASIATTFTFPSPVCVKRDKDYAIVVQPDALSPNYRVWTAEPGVPDVKNESLFTNKGWGLGTMFFSTSARVYTPVQNEDMKFVVRYADFSPYTGTVVLNNEDVEYLTVNTVSGSFLGGEDVAQMSNTYLNVILTTNTSSPIIGTSSSLTPTVSANDYVLVVYGTNNNISTANVKVTGTSVSNASSTTTAFVDEYSVGDFIRVGNEVRLVTNVASNTSLTVDAPFNSTITDSVHYSVDPEFEVLRVIAANSSSLTVNRPPNYTVNSSIQASLQKVVHGVVSYYNTGNGKLYLKDSNSSNSTFQIKVSNSTYLGYLVGDRSDALAKVASIDNIEFTEFTPFINTLQIPFTNINFSATFTKSSSGTGTSSYSLGGSNKVGLNDTVIIKSKTNEISGTTINKSLSASVTAATSYFDTTPIIDVNPSSIIVKKYNINNSNVNENTRYGNAQCKYISKRLELVESLEAEDIKVYIKAYRPSGTFIDVYAKILSSDDNESFNDKDWSELDLVTSSSLYSSSLNENDLREYEYTFKKTPSYSAITGRITTSTVSNTVTGSGTLFLTDLAPNDLVKLVYTSSTTDYDIIPVATVTDDTTIVLASRPSSSTAGATVEKVTRKKEAFKYEKNNSIVRYFDSRNGAHDAYRFLAIKVVLRSLTSYVVPQVDDIRAVAISV